METELASSSIEPMGSSLAKDGLLSIQHRLLFPICLAAFSESSGLIKNLLG
jgi:hypothetical protein